MAETPPPDAPRRRAKRLTQRSVLLAAAAAATFLTMRVGLSRAFGNAQPTVALTYDQSDSRARAAMAVQRIAGGVTPARARAAKEDALQSLRRDLTDPRPLEVMATIADARGDTAAARRFMDTSNALSRRTLLTRLWFIESAVQRGDVAAALHNFDIGLRSSIDARAVLFPTLVSALADPSLIVPIAKLLQTQPPWGPAFLLEASNSGVATANLARVVARLDPVPSIDGADLRRIVIARLVTQNDLASARLLAADEVRGGGAVRGVFDPAFGDPRGLPPFNWDFGQALDDLSVDRVADGSGGLEIVDRTGRGGVAAAQVLTLSPAGYALSLAVGPSAGQPLQAEISCADGRPLASTTGDRTAAFNVPAGCTTQWLRLIVPADDLANEKSYLVRRIDIERR